MRWFRALLPREERFFDLFEKHSEAVLAGAEALRAMMNGGERIAEYYAVVMEREHDADVVTRDVLMAIRRTFITPFDRGAIKDLITSMDNTIDQMQKTAKAIMLFEVRSFTPHMEEMADAIVSSAKLVRSAMPLLQSLSAEAGRLASITEQISQIEGRTDDLHDTGLKELFKSGGRSDAMSFIVGNEIYDHLWRKSSTASMTSPTKSTVSYSSRSDWSGTHGCVAGSAAAHRIDSRRSPF